MGLVDELLAQLDSARFFADEGCNLLFWKYRCG
jgi:hypothetical protein